MANDISLLVGGGGGGFGAATVVVGLLVVAGGPLAFSLYWRSNPVLRRFVFSCLAMRVLTFLMVASSRST